MGESLRNVQVDVGSSEHLPEYVRSVIGLVIARSTLCPVHWPIGKDPMLNIAESVFENRIGEFLDVQPMSGVLIKFVGHPLSFIRVC